MAMVAVPLVLLSFWRCCPCAATAGAIALLREQLAQMPIPNADINCEYRHKFLVKIPSVDANIN